MQLQRGNVVLCRVPTPLKQRTNFKLRPAIIVAKEQLNESLDEVMIVPCTSNTELPLTDTQYLIAGDEMVLAGVDVEWVIRCESIFTLHRSMILKKLGYLSPEAISQVNRCLMAALEL